MHRLRDGRPAMNNKHVEKTKYIHRDLINNNDHRVILSDHLFDKRLGDTRARGYIFESKQQLYHIIQHLLTFQDLEDYEDEGIVVVKFRYRNLICGLLLRITGKHYMLDIVSNIILISCFVKEEGTVDPSTIYSNAPQEIDLLDTSYTLPSPKHNSRQSKKYKRYGRLKAETQGVRR